MSVRKSELEMCRYFEDKDAEYILWNSGINVVEIHLHSNIFIFQVSEEIFSTNMQWKQSTMTKNIFRVK
jgi:hypothetical protein